VCDKPDHKTKKCYHRFDITYHDSLPNPLTFMA
jgi:hypothetical protein